MKFHREVDAHIQGEYEDQEIEATEVDALTDILAVVESIESHLENIGNEVAQGNQMAAEFYAEFFKRLTAAESRKE